MGKIKRYKNRVELFLSGESGQRFFNFAYSIGAAIVIWGALFKILHLPGGNLLLAIGMGTEVLMFLLTAFDRPPKQYNWEQVFPALGDTDEEDENVEAEGVAADANAAQGGNVVGGGTIYIQGGAGAPANGTVNAEGGTANAGGIAIQPLQSVAQPMPDLSQANDATENYVTQMEQVIQELEHMRQTTAALNTMYELQLRSISAQLGAIENSGRDISSMREMMERSARQSERYCLETEKMAENMATLNAIYAGMISAMSGSRNNNNQ